MAYKELFLDDSIFDLDSWLPQSAIDEIVQVIIKPEKSLFTISSIDNKKYNTVDLGCELNGEFPRYQGYIDDMRNSSKDNYTTIIGVEAA